MEVVEAFQKQVSCTKAQDISLVLQVIELELICSKSLKSRAAKRFIAEALLVKHRIVPRPKVGTCLYLRREKL